MIQFRPEARILEVIDSVEGAIKWLNTFEKPDLLFMDIQLSDGLSFDIFNHTEIHSPIIFTTAYDQYTLKAFKVNSVDYLLKPIDPDELKKAFVKFDKIYHQAQSYDKSAIENLLKVMTKKEVQISIFSQNRAAVDLYFSKRYLIFLFGRRPALCQNR